MRCGFTLIETLVALVILEFMMLALAATTAVAARDLANAHRSVRAQSLARNRMELLIATACTAQSSGSASPSSGFTEVWSVTSSGRARAVEVVVTYSLPGGKDTRVRLRSAVLCGT